MRPKKSLSQNFLNDEEILNSIVNNGNIKKDDIVWTVPNTFAASANCAINCGAKIDFVDINNETWIFFMVSNNIVFYMGSSF